MEQLELRQERKYCSRLGFAMLFVMAWMIAWQILFSVVDVLLPWDMPDSVYLILLSVGHYVLSLPVAFLICRRVPFMPPAWGHVSVWRILRWFIAGCAVMAAGSWIGSWCNDFIFQLVDKPPVDIVSETLDLYPFSVILLSVCFLAPIGEETVFRFLLAGRLARYGQAPAAVISALLFALFHTNLSQFFYAFGLGLLLAYAYFRTGRFWVPCLLHMLFNLYGSALPIALSVSEIALVFYGFAMLALDLAGVILLLFHWRGAVWEHGAYVPSVRAIFINPGMIMVVIACFVLTFISFLLA